jgi:hypothetical protein
MRPRWIARMPAGHSARFRSCPARLTANRVHAPIEVQGCVREREHVPLPRLGVGAGEYKHDAISVLRHAPCPLADLSSVGGIAEHAPGPRLGQAVMLGQEVGHGRG